MGGALAVRARGEGEHDEQHQEPDEAAPGDLDPFAERPGRQAAAAATTAAALRRALGLGARRGAPPGRARPHGPLDVRGLAAVLLGGLCLFGGDRGGEGRRHSGHLVGRLLVRDRRLNQQRLGRIAVRHADAWLERAVRAGEAVRQRLADGDVVLLRAAAGEVERGGANREHVASGDLSVRDTVSS